LFYYYIVYLKLIDQLNIDICVCLSNVVTGFYNYVFGDNPIRSLKAVYLLFEKHVYMDIVYDIIVQILISQQQEKC